MIAAGVRAIGGSRGREGHGVQVETERRRHITRRILRDRLSILERLQIGLGERQRVVVRRGPLDAERDGVGRSDLRSRDDRRVTIVDAMLDLAQVRASDVVFDLWSGDGRIRGDLFQTDISQASVVTLFLLPSINIQLIPKFKQQLRPGARIVAHHFAMGDLWVPDVEQDVSGLMIYLWKVRP